MDDITRWKVIDANGKEVAQIERDATGTFGLWTPAYGYDQFPPSAGAMLHRATWGGCGSLAPKPKYESSPGEVKIDYGPYHQPSIDR